MPIKSAVQEAPINAADGWWLLLRSMIVYFDKTNIERAYWHIFDIGQKEEQQMLKAAANAAERFLANAEISSNIAQRHALYNMWRLLQ